MIVEKFSKVLYVIYIVDNDFLTTPEWIYS